MSLELLNLLLSIFIGLFLLVILVVIHELGHAIVARRNGVVVEEFGIGFPPKAWSKKLKNGIEFSLNWLPLGGFVKLKGEHDSANKKGDYGNASLWVKMKILLAGVAINWLAAVLIFTILALTGLPKIIDNQFSVASDTREISGRLVVASVNGDSPAEAAGLKPGDQLLRFNGQPLPNPESLPPITERLKGETVEVIYSRDGKEATTSVTLRETNQNNQGYLGIGTSSSSVLRSTWSAPIVGFMTTVQFTILTLQGLGDILVNLGSGFISQFNFNPEVREAGSENLSKAGENVAGPIGILGVIFPAAREAGLTTLLLLTGIISLTLAVMNALPIPALDGGRVFLTLLFRALKRPLTKDIEEKINATGFLFILGLIILVTIADVGKFFR